MGAPGPSSSAASSPSSKKKSSHPPLPKSLTDTLTKTKTSIQDIPLPRPSSFNSTPAIHQYLHRRIHLLQLLKHHQKRNRSLEAPVVSEKRKKIKQAYLPGENVCREYRKQAERVFAQTRNPNDVKCLWNFHQINGRDIEVPQNFIRPKWVLTAVRSGSGTRQILGVVEEVSISLKVVPPAAYMNDNQMTELKQY